MHRLTSKRVITLGKPGCPVGKCNPLSSFHLWRELALSFLMSTLKKARKDCPPPLHPQCVHQMDFLEAYKLTHVLSHEDVVSERWGRLSPTPSIMRSLVLHMWISGHSFCGRQVSSMSAQIISPSLNSHHILCKPHATEASPWRQCRMYWNHPALLETDRPLFYYFQRGAACTSVHEGQSVHHNRKSMLIENTDVWSAIQFSIY